MRMDQKISTGLLVFVAVMGYFTVQLPDTIMEGEPGPKFFPSLILLTIAVLAVILFFNKGKAPEKSKLKSESLRLTPGLSAYGAMRYFGMFFAGLVLMKLVGFILSMIVTIAVMLTMAKWKLFTKAAVFSIVVVVIIYVTFERLLDIPLPRGILLDF